VNGARRYLEIVHALARRQLVGRYRGNVLGALPALAVPLGLLAAYTFVFSALVPVRLQAGAARADYAFFFFAGLVGWTLFAETVGRAPRLFVEQESLLRKALFPASALPLATALAAFYQSLIWAAVFLAARLATGAGPGAGASAAPLWLLLAAFFSAGVALAVASLGAFVRDLAELVGPALTVALFASPVLYPSERLAELSPWLVRLNPLAPLLEGLRATLLGEGVCAADLAAAAAWSAAALGAGALCHRRLRPALADVL
jgi:lipopolysaccharide transport system permease protein